MVPAVCLFSPLSENVDRGAKYLDAMSAETSSHRSHFDKHLQRAQNVNDHQRCYHTELLTQRTASYSTENGLSCRAKVDYGHFTPHLPG